ASNSCCPASSRARSPEAAPTAVNPAASKVIPSRRTNSGSSSTTRTRCICDVKQPQGCTPVQGPASHHGPPWGILWGMDRYLDPRNEAAPPALVVGTMNFGKRTDEPESHRIVQRALERGLDFFDTANAYVQGESERILGRALGKRRGQARIATKVGFGMNMSSPEGLAPERIVAALDESLERLGTDRV